MPEGLSDQDRAKIANARESTGGCLRVVAFVFFVLAAFFLLVGLWLISIFPPVGVAVVLVIAVLGLLGGLAFRWISSQ